MRHGDGPILLGSNFLLILPNKIPEKFLLFIKFKIIVIIIRAVEKLLVLDMVECSVCDTIYSSYALSYIFNLYCI